MRPRFHPRLINGPFDDPGLFIPFLYENRAILFDLGDIYPLSARDILKISHVFITHTHMDHFIGFDKLLRLFLSREKKVYLYGPEGFLKNCEGKLAGYTWNLVDNYNYRLRLHLTEIRSDQIISKIYHCRDKFIVPKDSTKHAFNGVLHKEQGFNITVVILNHSIPCLGFSVHEHFHVNIVKEGLKTLGLETGPWLTRFKQAIYSRTDADSVFEIKVPGQQKTRQFQLEELAEKIALITPGQKITYITDVVYDESNNQKIIEFARDSDLLFMEAAFLDKDHETARQKYHLTARQAGELAARAGAKQLNVFHFSPRYLGQENLLYEEALKAYKNSQTIS
ncbi:MAG: MBL fold metallo-hydrolase [Desulfobacterales bacterium]|jgi:ribonuclease Z